jgi:mannose-1-phosphate guanylyltransferase/mannose-6-phosphate isomerase
MTVQSPLPVAPPAGAIPRIVPAILCGGSGSRLWPVSRRELAKSHVPILGGPSPFRRTLHRVGGALFAVPIVVGAAGSQFLLADEAEAAGVAVELALEPEGRDTLAAVTLAACLAARRDPEAIVLVLPSDHLVPDVAAFEAAVAAAARVAAEGRIVVLGIPPAGPSPAYGYIAPGAPLGPEAFVVDRFVEKPDAARAATLIAGGALWNAGLFCFRAADGLREIAALAPGALAAVQRALAEAGDAAGGPVLAGPAFAEAPRTSFDHAVMERTRRAAVVPAAFPWSDIGDWKAVWEMSRRDARGVASEGRVHAVDVADSYLRSDGRLLCVLGVTGLAVVDTADAVLVAPIERAQEVKGLVGDLEARGFAEAVAPARVHRPWGWFQTVDLGPRFRVKRIVVLPGKRFSLQKHHHRAEHWIVVRGTAQVTRDGEVVLVRENESIYLPLGCTHRLENPGRIAVEIVEVQTGAYLEEDDIVRFEDDFGRS